MAEVWAKARYWFPQPDGKWGENKERIKDREWFECASPRQWAAQDRGKGEGIRRVRKNEGNRERQGKTEGGFKALQQPLRKAHRGEVWLTGCFTRGNSDFCFHVRAGRQSSPVTVSSFIWSIPGFLNQDPSLRRNKSSESNDKVEERQPEIYDDQPLGG